LLHSLPVSDHDLMHRFSSLFDPRVAVVVGAGLTVTLAVPGQASGDKRSISKPALSVPAPAPSPGVARSSPTVTPFDLSAWGERTIGAIDPKVLSLALSSAEHAIDRGDASVSTLAVIDFSRPSTERRLWVYDLRARELLFEDHVSHGRNSGHNLATMFSNEPDSHKSSLGLYRAAESYIGKHGYSLRLDGLEAGFNDRARERAIVIHGAEYVNAETARLQGRLGRSLGCPAVRPTIARELIDAVKDGGLVFAYYPDPEWLNTSTYLP
jgi:hypothetical protein